MNENLSLGDMNTLTGEDVLKNSQLLFSGDEIGDYKVIRQLGAGGMGQVYLVENIHMHKQYALKVLPPNLSKNKNFIDRFRIEARVMADLEHPNIVGVHNIGHDKERGLFYLVMEYVDSITNEELRISNVGANGICLTENPSDLEQLLKQKKKLDENYVLKITKQLCSALDYAHNFRGNGIVHRDLKPSNILLDVDGNAHIADFGLAKVVGSDYLRSMIDRSMRLTMAGSAGGTADLSLGDMNTMVGGQTTDGRPETVDSSNSKLKTQNSTGTGTAGSLIGTYEYMAPEQQEGVEATVQSDIYSLGLIIYRMLTGRKAKGRFKLPSHFGVSEYWDDIIEKCTEHEPEDRFESVANIIDLLNSSVTTTNTKNAKRIKEKKLKAKKPRNISKPQRESRKGIISVLLVLLILCGVGAGTFFVYQYYQKKTTEKSTIIHIAQDEKTGKTEYQKNTSKIDQPVEHEKKEMGGSDSDELYYTQDKNSYLLKKLGHLPEVSIDGNRISKTLIIDSIVSQVITLLLHGYPVDLNKDTQRRKIIKEAVTRILLLEKAEKENIKVTKEELDNYQKTIPIFLMKNTFNKSMYDMFVINLKKKYGLDKVVLNNTIEQNLCIDILMKRIKENINLNNKGLKQFVYDNNKKYFLKVAYFNKTEQKRVEKVCLDFIQAKKDGNLNNFLLKNEFKQMPAFTRNNFIPLSKIKNGYTIFNSISLLKPNCITDVISTGDGYLIVYLEKFEYPDNDQLEKLMKESLSMYKLYLEQKVWNDYLEKLKKKIKIIIK